MKKLIISAACILTLTACDSGLCFKHDKEYKELLIGEIQLLNYTEQFSNSIRKMSDLVTIGRDTRGNQVKNINEFAELMTEESKKVNAKAKHLMNVKHLFFKNKEAQTTIKKIHDTTETYYQVIEELRVELILNDTK